MGQAGGVTAFDDALAAVEAGVEPQEAAQAVVEAMTPEERLWCLDGDAPFWAGLTDLGSGGYHKGPFAAARVERVGLPGFAFSDGPRGVVVDRATCFPVSMARGATWDLDLEERIGEAIGQELRAVGATLYGGVCVNVLRHPAWGRAQETYGEDPHHVGELGAALTRGVQRHAMACVKHFACNSMENARFKVDVRVDDEALREVYLPQFRRIVDEGVAVVMSAYNRLNGDWCGESGALLTEVLREEWGFRGFVISDWIFGLRDAARSLGGGLDVEMPYRMIRAEDLPEALDAGDASWADVDLAVTRLVATLLRFDETLRRPPPGREVLACEEHRALAREAAAKSVVLLRNEPVDGRPVLPLDPAPGSLAVIGELADAVNLGDGGSSEVWPPDVVTVLDGIRAALPGTHVVFDDGTDPGAAASVAGAVEVALVVVGYTLEDEGEYIGQEGTAHLTKLFPGPDDPELAASFEQAIAARPVVETPHHVVERAGFGTGGDRESLRLHDPDVALLGAVAAANPRTVVAIVAGSAVVISDWDAHVPAVVQAWYGGMEAGPGLADVLLGAVDASGRLPFSVPSHEGHLRPFERDAEQVTYDRWHGWWHLEREGHRAAYPFGFGLSYTAFELRGFETIGDAGGFRVSGAVANTGSRAGTDVVQVYARPVADDGPRRLVGFARVDVPAGERREVDVTVTPPLGTSALEVARHACDPRTQVLPLIP